MIGCDVMRRFNVTTTCVKHLHYMADNKKKTDIIIDMIEAGYYFTINRGRQTGKTTILKLLAKELSDKYLMIPASFEGMSSLFESEETFSAKIFEVFAKPFAIFNSELAVSIKNRGKDLRNMEVWGKRSVNGVMKVIKKLFY